jgi:hypothetical protein
LFRIPCYIDNVLGVTKWGGPAPTENAPAVRKLAGALR